MAIVKSKLISKKRELDENIVSFPKVKKIKVVKTPSQKLQKAVKPSSEKTLSAPKIKKTKTLKSKGEKLQTPGNEKKVKSPKIETTKPLKPEGDKVQKPVKPKSQKKVQNLISLKRYEPRVDAIAEKHNIPVGLVEANVGNIVKLVEENPKIQHQILEIEKFPIFLQLNVFKVPKCHPKLVRIQLEHSLLDTDDDICFIVPDLKQFKNKEYEKQIEFYEDLLKQKGIENVKTIMTLHQLKSEYENFELKRGLVELYDMFLVDGRISGRVVHQLGKVFYKKRKIPTPIKMDSVNLQKNFEAALKKSTFQIHGNGDSFMVQIGHNKMCERELVENVYAAIEDLDKVFPGGIKNMKSINIFARRGSSLPIYVSIGNPNEVKVPRVAIKKPKLAKTVEGELTTKLGMRVKVKPTGKVVVKQIKQ